MHHNAISRMKCGVALSAFVLGVSTFTFAGAAHAQDAPAQEQDVDDQAAKDIVVTGSLIRGVSPTGSNTVDLSNEDMKLSGVIDSNAMLTQLLPQSEGFMDSLRLQPGRNNAGGRGLLFVGPVVRASLRNLGDSFSGTGAPTLVLLDGNRIVPAGYAQSAVDVGIIPSSILERTEIVLDGTSAVYGSDAVGGTINYIPRKRFDETKVSVNYGFADDYWQASADVTTGLSWDGGGIGFAYSFGKNSDLLEREREWTIPRNYLEGARLTSLACEGYGHAVIGARRFLATAGSTAMPEQTNWCELGYNTTVQKMERHSGFVTFSQDLTDTIKLDIYGFYSKRSNEGNQGPFTSASTITAGNPYYRQIAGTAANAPQQVSFSWGPVFGNNAQVAKSSLEVGQVSPSITVDLGGDWQVKVLGTYGKSKVTVDQVSIDTTLVGSLIGGGAANNTLLTAINPYDIAATQTKSLFGNLLWHDHTDGIHQFKQARIIADGPLFTLPGGEVRVAVGAEWSLTNFKRRNTNAQTHIRNPFLSAKQRDMAAFAEVNVPVVGPDNSMPGIDTLTLSGSARYDDYSNTGGTFNPKLSLNYKPVDWFTIRGSWGKSFRAPNVVDILGVQSNTISCSSGTDPAPGCPTSGTFFTVPDGVTLDPVRSDVVLGISGSGANLSPEKSTNWSIGADIAPPVLPGFRVSATYWHIKFTDRIGTPPVNPNDAFRGDPSLITKDPTAAQIAAFLTQAQNGSTVGAIISSNNYRVLYLSQGTTANLSTSLVSGLDLAANYTHPTSFGSVDAGFDGTWLIKQDTQLIKGAPIVDGLRVNVPTFTMSATLGANIGNFRAQGTFQHRSGYDVDPAVTRDPTQTHIPSYHIFNASFRYDVEGTGPLAKDLTLTLVVNNVFDKAPPINRTTLGIAVNGTTIGRVISFGIEKAF